jgi:hypothetical protein
LFTFGEVAEKVSQALAFEMQRLAIENILMMPLASRSKVGLKNDCKAVVERRKL